MKIDINKVPFEELPLEEDLSVSMLDLETDVIKFSGPIKIRAKASKITNAVTVDLILSSQMHISCSRCLEEFDIAFNKKLKLNYQADKLHPIIDLGPDIREEIIVDYPIKPLCKPECLGLCFKCGKNLNQGGCNCAIT